MKQDPKEMKATIAITYNDIIRSTEPNARHALDSFYARTLREINSDMRRYFRAGQPRDISPEKSS